MQFKFTGATLLQLGQLLLIVILFIIIVATPKKEDNTAAIIEQNRKFWARTQEEVKQSTAKIETSITKINELQEEVATLSDLETVQQEELHSILKNIKSLKNDFENINYSDSSSNAIFNFLSNKVSGGSN